MSTLFYIDKPIAVQLFETCEVLLPQLTSSSMLDLAASYTPDSKLFGGEKGAAQFACLDFALADVNGEVTPRLVEAQLFPSISHWCLQVEAAFSPSSARLEQRFQTLADIVSPKNKSTILLDVAPQRQKSRFDFDAAVEEFGLRVVCYSELMRIGDSVYIAACMTKVDHIYNRLIFCELEEEERTRVRQLFLGANVTWANHPDWYIHSNKSVLTRLKHSNVPAAEMLTSQTTYRQNCVLKPIYGNSGNGVIINPTPDEFNQCGLSNEYLLQEWIPYAEVKVEDKRVKAEVRMMYLLTSKAPMFLTSMVRYGQAAKMNLNGNKIAVGLFA